LNTSDDARGFFERRAKLYRQMRHFLDDHDFIEVETLNPLHAESDGRGSRNR